MIEAANNSRASTKVQRTWGMKGLVKGTPVQEFLPFLAAEEFLLQMHSRDRFMRGISTNSMPVNAPNHLYWCLEEQGHCGQSY